ncbi:MAG: hypothetical protein UR39_C0003G0039 [Candidatus Woesebacteria bacterium GW2011_GWA1_33_30]|uniref:Integrin alpha beta-propellor repeat protein n=1 Tax=Candidatus Woesebacteria bacterium GW2011_GWA2_33_28 TaxID=1618561 RepID=A0A0G0CWA3_9BACT|nr:MAG: hypothetical protein UR38_C0003G0042 [Candidatus Woesebacteria bacterium GW2011_GWA2_33_28]KKP48504.1 MAG: hypothetical protein UR39_C0003G0039 [Candidatus Woesebacteria bacterium GW2011_GWA1_33_30]KKP49643.1 MAG: hypothetical protein UR40_C0004G0042 [Microgenomates group bacterium GW2011_GWC1_33_32]KKP52260.1 MAG: hypothetical protein UR44_C0003G0042 [Candidatus Woesebacteria bacterium GW2011_GWB1_33_38]
MENKYINIMKNKNKIVTLGIIATTIVLAGIAIFTAIKLYQTKNVAPTDSNAAAGPKVCKVSFTVTGPTTTPTPTAPPNIVCNSVCQQTTDCPTGLICYGAGPGPATSGRCRRQACTSKTNCICATPTATATATATPKQCNSLCTAHTDCTSNLRCLVVNSADSSAKRCRKETCSTETDCVCPGETPTATPTATATSTGTGIPTATATATATSNPQCNNSCTQNTDCPNGLMCYIASGATSGSCRNTSCLSENDCLCPPEPTETSTSIASVEEEPELPSVGTTWPTIVGTVFGILVILGSLLLAF